MFQFCCDSQLARYWLAFIIVLSSLAQCWLDHMSKSVVSNCLFSHLAGQRIAQNQIECLLPDRNYPAVSNVPDSNFFPPLPQFQTTTTSLLVGTKRMSSKSSISLQLFPEIVISVSLTVECSMPNVQLPLQACRSPMDR